MDESIIALLNRLRTARIRILNKYPFYGILLTSMPLCVSKAVPTACTDAVRIIFGLEFGNNLDDGELEFVMMHEIMHVVLRHCFRGVNYNNERYNIAADIVSNSLLMKEAGRTKPFLIGKYGPAMHLAPDGKEGAGYTAEEVYDMLKNPSNSNATPIALPGSGAAGEGGSAGGGEGASDENGGGRFDDHSKWGIAADEELVAEWTARVENAAEIAEMLEKNCGKGTVLGNRILNELRNPVVNWKEILDAFLTFVITDYTFSPPDHRYDDSPFFLPDFSEPEPVVGNVWFVIDTSGSMSDGEIADAYSEIKGAIDTYDGHIEGKLSFMDYSVTEPVPFCSEDELLDIKPLGGGGTNFQAIFDFMQDEMEELPLAVVIITDGECSFPDEEDAMDVPVMWLMTTAAVAPWGKTVPIRPAKQ